MSAKYSVCSKENVTKIGVAIYITAIPYAYGNRKNAKS